MLVPQVAHEQHLAANSRLKQFTVHHYNHAVKYDADGFVERNRDKLHTSVAKLLGASTNNMVRRYDFVCRPPDTVGSKVKTNDMWRHATCTRIQHIFPTCELVVWLDRSCSWLGCTRMRRVTETVPPRVRPPSRRKTTSTHGWRCSSRRRPDLRAGARECRVFQVYSLRKRC